VLNLILIMVYLIVCVLLVALVLMHSGKDAGMSSVSGFSFAAQASVMERNLTRYTIATGIVYFVLSFVLAWRL
jgi:preprotein translocase subunit SecG